LLTIAALFLAAPEGANRRPIVVPEGCESNIQGRAFIVNSEQKEQLTEADLMPLEKCLKPWMEYMLADEKAKQQAEATRLGACKPQTYEAALLCLDQHLSPDTKKLLLTDDGRTSVHFGLGMFIRNNWGLWGGGPLFQSMKALGFTHPDDMSAVLFDAFAARQAGQAYDLAAKAKEYEDYWANNADEAPESQENAEEVK
jgi:hypothetical protein